MAGKAWWPALAMLLASSVSGCSQHECPDLNWYGGVAERCLDSWMPTHYIVHLHHLDIKYDASDDAMIVTAMVTSLVAQAIIFDGATANLGDQWGGIGSARQELGGTDWFRLDPLETKQLTMRMPNPTFNGNDGSVAIDLSFEDVRNPTGNSNGLAITLSNSCVKLQDGQVVPGEGEGFDKCRAEDLASNYDDASINIRMYGFEPKMEANLPGPHDVAFWHRYCPSCYDDMPPEKFGPVP